MIDVHKDGLVQRMMATLCNVSPTTISRYIASNNLKPIDKLILKNQRFSIEDSRKIIEDVSNFKKNKIKNRKLAFYNFKGGVGKTSLCYQISSHLALVGYNVLVIDSDPQAHLSASLGFHTEENHLTLYDLLIREEPFCNVKKTIFRGLDCIPSNLSLTRIEDSLAKLKNKTTRLSYCFSSIEKKYDFILVDTNPTISLLNRNIAIFSDAINIVCETQPYAINGLKLLLEDLDRFYTQMKTNIRDINIIPNKYEDRLSSSAEGMTVLRDYYGDHIKKDFAIRKSGDIKVSGEIGKPLALFAKRNSTALKDIVELLHHQIFRHSVTEK